MANNDDGILITVGIIIAAIGAVAYVYCSKNLCNCIALTGGHCDYGPPVENPKPPKPVIRDKMGLPQPKETPIRKCYDNFDKTGRLLPTKCWRDYPCPSRRTGLPSNKPVAICQLTCEGAKAKWQKGFGCKSASALALAFRMPTIA